MKFTSPSIIINLFFVSIFISACSPNQSGRNSEGSITYKIDYLDNQKNNPMISLLPDKMVLNFKNNKTQSSIKGFANLFELTYVSDLNKKKGFSTLRMPGKKYIYEFDLKDALGYENMEDLEIQLTPETKEICGLKCNKAIGTSSAFEKPIDIYYTDLIQIADPNFSNPFKDIKGVLLEFTANMNGISMFLTAEKLSEIEIEDEIFNKPEGYTSVSKEEMLNIVNEFNQIKTK